MLIYVYQAFPNFIRLTLWPPNQSFLGYILMHICSLLEHKLSWLMEGALTVVLFIQQRLQVTFSLLCEDVNLILVGLTMHLLPFRKHKMLTLEMLKFLFYWIM